MTPQESALLDLSLPAYQSRLPLSLWANVASIFPERPVGLAEFHAWWDGYNRRHAKLLADAVAYLERQG